MPGTLLTPRGARAILENDQPSGAAPGTVRYDEDDNNKPYVLRNGLWVSVRDATIATAQGAANAAAATANAAMPSTVEALGTLINGATAKNPPVDADQLALMDSADSNHLKKLSWAYVKSVLKTYFDSLYSATGAYFRPGGGIPSSDMATAVQTSLGKADSATQGGYVKPAPGIPSTDMTAAVIASLALANGAAPWTALADWTPTVTCSGSMTITGGTLVITEAKYCLVGKLFIFWLNLGFTLGGSVSNIIIVTAPNGLTLAGVSLSGFIRTVDGAYDHGHITRSGNNLYCYKRAQDNWSTGAGKGLTGFGVCQIA